MKVALCRMAHWEQDLEDPKSELCREAVCIDLQGRCKGGTPVPMLPAGDNSGKTASMQGQVGGRGTRGGLAWNQGASGEVHPEMSPGLPTSLSLLMTQYCLLMTQS